MSGRYGRSEEPETVCLQYMALLFPRTHLQGILYRATLIVGARHVGTKTAHKWSLGGPFSMDFSDVGDVALRSRSRDHCCENPWLVDVDEECCMASDQSEERCDLGRSCGGVGSLLSLRDPFLCVFCSLTNAAHCKVFDPNQVVSVLYSIRASYFSRFSCALLCSALLSAAGVLRFLQDNTVGRLGKIAAGGLTR